jgi:SAM-dependent methyltransferase
MAKISGCDVVLVDLPLAGLRIAVQRAGRERIPARCWTVVADAAMLPFADDSFDAVSHSDLLCCLREKRAVLESCRGAIRNHGTMAFTVISIAPDLSPGEYRRALANGPEFVEADADYQTLLAQAGWATVDRRDITLDYADSHRRQLEADASGKDALETLLGASEVAERRSQWQSNLDALRDGLLRRELFVATPRRASA